MESEEAQESQPVASVKSLNVLCSICNEFFKSNSNICSTVNCGHVFHKDCLMPYVNRSRRCPQCHASCHRLRTHQIFFKFAKNADPEGMEGTKILWVPLNMKDPIAFTNSEGVVQCGTDHEGFDTYVARVHLTNELLPANYVPQKKHVHVTWACNAHLLNTSVDILLLTDCDINWVPAENGYVPPNALKSGYSNIGEPLYTGRALYKGQTILGKVHPSHRLLYFPYDHDEIGEFKYEVLVITSREHADR